MSLNAQFNAYYQKQRGFSYAEVLLSISLIIILIVPAMQALNGAIRGGANCLAERQFLLRNKMEEVLSKPFEEIYTEASTTSATNTNSTFSDAATPVTNDTCGSTYRRMVVLYRTTNANTATFTSTDSGLVYAQVYFSSEGATNALNTLVGRWW